MNVSPKTIEMIKHHEGVRFKPYQCPAKLWTIGVGHVLYPNQGKMPIDQRSGYALHPEDNRAFSKDEVNAILRADLARFEKGVATYCPVPLTQGQFDALVSFSFNVLFHTIFAKLYFNQFEWTVCFVAQLMPFITIDPSSFMHS